MLAAVSSGPFYKKFVQLPTTLTPPSDYILNNSKLYPFFRNALGAFDGTHIHSFVTALDRHASGDRKGTITQNCLAVCSFNFRFLYFISGFEGSIADATMFMHARLMDFLIPEGKFYLADAGFAHCDAALTPYRNVRYHLAEWGRAAIRSVIYFSYFYHSLTCNSDTSPANKEELFNLRHAQARNVIERIFGVMKKRWAILTHAPQYPMSAQSMIPPGLAAVHNFILEYDADDLENYLDPVDINEDTPDIQDNISGTHGDGAIQQEEKERASKLRDKIASAMWESYQQFLHDHPHVLEQEFDAENE